MTPSGSPLQARLVAVSAAMGLALAACAVPVEVGLDDAEANRVFLALDRAGVDATKEQDPSAEGRWRINVAREDVARALVAMKEDGLPRRDPAAADPGAKGGPLVPSEAAERARILGDTASELRASLESIDGVLAARVHLSAPEGAAGGLRELVPAVRGSASVLFEYRGATPPVSADAVQRLVAGAVAGLATTDVSVVMVSRSAPPTPAGALLGHVGPIAVARSSMFRLQAALAGLAALAAILSGAVLALWVRLARTRGAAAEPNDPGADGAEVPSGPREQPAALRRGA